MFDDAIKRLAHSSDAPFMPIMIQFEDGTRLSATSIEARLSTVHDDTLSGISIEMVIPVNDDIDQFFKQVASAQLPTS